MLLEYKARHGNTQVLQKSKKYPELGRWVTKRRYWYRKKKILVDHALHLESIGFLWSVPGSSKWDEMYQLLLEYKAKHGNTSSTQLQ